MRCRCAPRLHLAGEALGEDLNLPTDRSFLALEIGLELVHPGEALLELARGRGPRGHASPRCRFLLSPLIYQEFEPSLQRR